MKRFQDKAVMGRNGCWVWTGCKTRQGYGLFSLNGKNTSAHRVSYELFVAPIPPGLVIDHLCRNTSCVNPKHLEPVTTQENNIRAADGRARPNLCDQGHSWTSENTMLLRTFGKDGEPHRACRTCKRAYELAKRSKNREAI